MTEQGSSYFRILALDGGGIRGIFSAKLLSRLEAAQPGSLANIDLFAGTSTGGLIALALANGRTPNEIIDRYVEDSSKVFARLRFIPAGLPIWFLLTFGLFLAKYANRNLEHFLIEEFGADTKLGDLQKHVLITSFDLDYGRGKGKNEARPGYHGNRTWKPKFFHNLPVGSSDAHESVVDVAMRTAAAPVYFPSYQGYIDGGVVANNPSFVALLQAIYASPEPMPKLEDVALLSIGTGQQDQFIPGDHLDWGIAQWSRRLLEISLDSGPSMTDWQCRKMLGTRYHRLNPELGKHVPLDAVRVEDIGYLLNQAVRAKLVERVRSDVATEDWLGKYFR